MISHPASILRHEIGQATSGLLADGRHIANRARDEASNHRDIYNSPPPLKVCWHLLKWFKVFMYSKTITDRLGLYVQAYTLYSSVRPFGISSILGAVDKDGPQLYVIEPSGVFFVRIVSRYYKRPWLIELTGLLWGCCGQGPSTGENRAGKTSTR